MEISDAELAEKVKSEYCSDSLTELISRHTGLCVSMAHKYFNNRNTTGVHINDFDLEKNWIVYDAAKEFDPSRNVKFSTFLANKVRYFCLNKIKSNNLVPLTDETLDAMANQYSEEDLHLEELEYVWDILDQIKDKRVKTIFKYRYGQDKDTRDWATIGKKLGMSHQGVIDIHNKAISFIRNKINSKNTCDFI